MTLDLNDCTLSASLQKALHELAQLRTDDEQTRDRLVIMLATLTRLADSLERELAVFRLGETGQQARTILERESTNALNALPAVGDNKIVRPDFGGQS